MSSDNRPDHLRGWSDEENETLLRLKSQYENWKDIHELGLFPNRSPAAVQAQYWRLRNGRPRPGVGHVRVRPKPTSTPNINPLKRSIAAAADSPKQPVSSPEPSRKSRRIMDGADYQDPDPDSHSDSSEGEDLPWNCNGNSEKPTPSQPQSFFQKPQSRSAGTEQAPGTPTAIKPADTSQTQPTVNKPETPQTDPSSKAALHPPDRFRATPANAVAPGKSSAEPSSGNNSPAPPEPICHASGFTSVNQASRRPSIAYTPQSSALPREGTRTSSGTPSMQPPSGPAHKATPASTPAAQTQAATGTSPAPVSSNHAEKSATRPTIAMEKTPNSSTPTQAEESLQASTPPVPTQQPRESSLTAPGTTSKPVSASPQSEITVLTSQAPQMLAPMPSATEKPKLPALELFNRANEFISRGIDAVVEDMTRDQWTKIENLRSCLSKAIAERDSLERQLEKLKKDNKGMEEYIQNISDMASRFTRRD